MTDWRGPNVVSREIGETCRLCGRRLKVGENIFIFAENGRPWPVHGQCWDPRTPLMHEPKKSRVTPEESEIIRRDVRTFWDAVRTTWRLCSARRDKRRRERR